MTNTLDRRNFLTISTAALGAGLSSQAVAAPKSRRQAVDYDVIVIGGGGAGLPAAMMAADAGAKVMLADAGPRLGGAVAISGAAYRLVDKAAIDAPYGEYTDAMALNRYQIEPSLVRRYFEESGNTLDWLTNVIKFNGKDMPRNVRGQALVDKFETRLKSAGVKIATNTRVRKLVMENGAVVGVEVDGKVLRSHAVVVATGGFAANEYLLQKHYPAAAEVAGHWWYGPPTHQGDAILFGKEVGADFTGHDRGLRVMSPGLRPPIVGDFDVGFPPYWSMIVNTLGRRFFNEHVQEHLQDTILSAQPGRKGFVILDHATFSNPPPADRNLHWTRDMLAEGLKTGKIVTAPTLEELAEKVGIRAGSLTPAVARYNGMVAAGKDTDFFKEPESLRAIGKGPYYAATMTMKVIVLTAYGMRIDKDTRVLSTTGEPIPGLYSAGEASGGLMGDIYFRGGSGLPIAMTMGRQAGIYASAYAKSRSATA